MVMSVWKGRALGSETEAGEVSNSPAVLNHRRARSAGD